MKIYEKKAHFWCYSQEKIFIYNNLYLYIHINIKNKIFLYVINS